MNQNLSPMIKIIYLLPSTGFIGIRLSDSADVFSSEDVAVPDKFINACRGLFSEYFKREICPALVKCEALAFTRQDIQKQIIEKYLGGLEIITKVEHEQSLLKRKVHTKKIDLTHYPTLERKYELDNNVRVVDDELFRRSSIPTRAIYEMMARLNIDLPSLLIAPPMDSITLNAFLQDIDTPPGDESREGMNGDDLELFDTMHCFLQRYYPPMCRSTPLPTDK